MKKFEDRVEKVEKVKPEIKTERKMSKNFLYSLCVHLGLFLLVYLSFNFSHKHEAEHKEKVVINFVINTKAPDANKPPKPAQMIPPPEPIKKEPSIVPEKPIEKKPEKKKEEPKKPKVEEAKSKAKTGKIKEVKPKKEPKKEPEKVPEKKPEKKKEEPKKEEKKIEEIKKEEPKEEPKEVAPEQPSFTENTIDKLDLLVREKFNIQSQIVGCYKRAIEQFGGKSKEAISVHIELDRDGSIDQKEILIKDFDRYKNPSELEFRKGVDIVKQTLSFCSPLHNLPEDKYDIWKEIDMQFDGGI